jgi:hypothetical protein
MKLIEVKATWNLRMQNITAFKRGITATSQIVKKLQKQGVNAQLCKKLYLEGAK